MLKKSGKKTKKRETLSQANYKKKFIRPKNSRQENTVIDCFIQKNESRTSTNHIVSKLESSIKLFKFLKKYEENSLFFVFLHIKQRTVSFIFSKKLLIAIKNRLKSVVFAILSNNKIAVLKLCNTGSISIFSNSKKSSFSVIQESSFNFFPSRADFSPLNVNYRYSNADQSDSQVLTFDLSPQHSFELPNLSYLESLDQESQKNTENNSNCNNFNLSRDDSIVELEDKCDSMRSELSPIIFSKENQKKTNFKVSEVNIISTSTMSIDKIAVFRKKIDILYSKEDTIEEIPFCEKSDSIEIKNGLKSVFQNQHLRSQKSFEKSKKLKKKFIIKKEKVTDEQKIIKKFSNLLKNYFKRIFEIIKYRSKMCQNNSIFYKKLKNLLVFVDRLVVRSVFNQ